MSCKKLVIYDDIMNEYPDLVARKAQQIALAQIEGWLKDTVDSPYTVPSEIEIGQTVYLDHAKKVSYKADFLCNINKNANSVASRFIICCVAWYHSHTFKTDAKTACNQLLTYVRELATDKNEAIKKAMELPKMKSIANKRTLLKMSCSVATFLASKADKAFSAGSSLPLRGCSYLERAGLSSVSLSSPYLRYSNIEVKDEKTGRLATEECLIALQLTLADQISVARFFEAKGASLDDLVIFDEIFGQWQKANNKKLLWTESFNRVFHIIRDNGGKRNYGSNGDFCTYISGDLLNPKHVIIAEGIKTALALVTPLSFMFFRDNLESFLILSPGSGPEVPKLVKVAIKQYPEAMVYNAVDMEKFLVSLSQCKKTGDFTPLTYGVDKDQTVGKRAAKSIETGHPGWDLIGQKAVDFGAIPLFPKFKGDPGKDFADMHKLYGEEYIYEVLKPQIFDRINTLKIPSKSFLVETIVNGQSIKEVTQPIIDGIGQVVSMQLSESGFLSNDSKVFNMLVNGVLSDKPSNFLIKAPMGTGKTRLLLDVKNELYRLAIEAGRLNPKILVISPRNGLGADIARQLGFKTHLEEKASLATNSLVCSVIHLDNFESVGINGDQNLAKCPAFDLVFVDESEACVQFLLSPKIGSGHKRINKARESIINGWKNALNTAKCVVFADATLAKSSGLFLNIIRGNVFNTTLIVGSSAPFAETRAVVCYSYVGTLTMDILSSVKAGQKVYVACMARTAVIRLASMLAKECPNKKVLAITKENSKEAHILDFVSNPNNECLKYDAVLVSPSIDTGLSISCQHFDKVFGISSNTDGTGDPQSFVQSLRRVRTPKDTTLRIFLDRNSNLSEILKYKLATREYIANFQEKKLRSYLEKELEKREKRLGEKADKLEKKLEKGYNCFISSLDATISKEFEALCLEVKTQFLQGKRFFSQKTKQLLANTGYTKFWYNDENPSNIEKDYKALSQLAKEARINAILMAKELDESEYTRVLDSGLQSDYLACQKFEIVKACCNGHYDQLTPGIVENWSKTRTVLGNWRKLLAQNLIDEAKLLPPDKKRANCFRQVFGNPENGVLAFCGVKIRESSLVYEETRFDVLAIQDYVQSVFTPETLATLHPEKNSEKMYKTICQVSKKQLGPVAFLRQELGKFGFRLARTGKFKNRIYHLCNISSSEIHSAVKKIFDSRDITRPFLASLMPKIETSNKTQSIEDVAKMVASNAN